MVATSITFSKVRFAVFVAITIVVAIVEALNWHLPYVLQMAFWLLYIPAAICATYLLATAMPHRWMRSVAVAFGVVMFAKLGVLDHRLATREFRQICEKEAGISIYQVSYLPKEEFSEKTGLPHFVDQRDFKAQLRKRGLERKGKEINRYMGTWGWYRSISFQIVRSSDNVVLGEVRDFTWHGGGPPILLGRQTRKCENVETSAASEMMRRVFRPVP